MTLPLLLSSFAFVLVSPLVRNQLRAAAGNPTELMPGDRLTLRVTPSGGGSQEAEIVSEHQQECQEAGHEAEKFFQFPPVPLVQPPHEGHPLLRVGGTFVAAASAAGEGEPVELAEAVLVGELEVPTRVKAMTVRLAAAAPDEDSGERSSKRPRGASGSSARGGEGGGGNSGVAGEDGADDVAWAEARRRKREGGCGDGVAGVKPRKKKVPNESSPSVV